MQRKKKRSIIFELHSIPIKIRSLWTNTRKNIISSLSPRISKRLYLVSYSIPLSCMVVLLLGLGFMINPGLFLVDKSSAVTIRDEWTVKNPDEFASIESAEPDVQNTDVINDNAEGDNDSGIMPMAENPDGEDTEPSIALTVTNTDQVVQAAQGGSAVYGSYRIGISGVGITEYTLSIKAESVNLIPPSGSSSIISGAGNKTGNNMAAGTWGYALTDTSTATSNYANLTYKNLPTVDTAILSDKGIMEWRLGVDKDLIFAAKFGEDVTPGNYSSHITLNVVATPRVTTAKWSNGVDSLITTMQEVESGFCKNNSKIGTGNTITLKDNRDQTPYIVVKLGDKCWMGQNLALTGPVTLAPGDTDLPAGTTWDLPASVTSWNTSDNNLAQVRTGSTSLSGWKSGYGNYYSWRAATAGTGTTSVTSTDASGSICPKGWKLPPNSGADSYSTLTGTKSGWTSTTFNGNSGVSGYFFGSTATNIYKGANFWPAAGYVYLASGALASAGSSGYYWSRTAYSNNSSAYYLYFNSSGVGPASSSYRWYGLSVRCVATY